MNLKSLGAKGIRAGKIAGIYHATVYMVEGPDLEFETKAEFDKWVSEITKSEES